MEACSIDDISEVLILLGFVMSIFALIHIILGLLTHYEEKECFEFTARAWSKAPIFSTYWVIVIGTGITQFVLQCWAWPVFLGKDLCRNGRNTPKISFFEITRWGHCLFK